jgi:hypothetical protein
MCHRFEDLLKKDFKTDIYKSDIKLKEPFKIAIMEITTAQSVFVRILTDTGLYGQEPALWRYPCWLDTNTGGSESAYSSR